MRIFSLMVIMLSLWGCASGPQTAKVDTEDTTTSLDQADDQIVSEIDKIIQRFQANKDQAALELSLISLANDYQTENDCVATNTVVKFALPILASKSAQDRANILRSECILLEMERAKQQLVAPSLSQMGANNPYDLVLSWQTGMDDAVLSPDWSARESIVSAYVLAGQQNFQDALHVTLQHASSASPLQPYLTDFAFDSFAHLSGPERESMLAQYSELTAFESLLDVIEDTRIDDNQRQDILTELVTELSLSDRLRSLPAHISRFLRIDFNKQHNIAVLLPLSGRLAVQGEAIKQGILASYFASQTSSDEYEQALDDNEMGVLASELNESAEASASLDIMTQGYDERIQAPSNTIVFIDTGSDDSLPETINQQTLAAYDTVIGPLLKPQITTVQNMLVNNTSTVHLNQLDNISVATDKQSTLPKDEELDQNESDLAVVSESTAIISGVSEDETGIEIEDETLSDLPELLRDSSELQSNGLLERSSMVDTEAFMPVIKARYFALSPEQEAQELALEMIQSDIKQAIIVHKGTRSTNRMTEAFLSTWEAENKDHEKHAPIVVTYADNKAVRVGITSALDVMQSQQRINQLSNLSNEEVYSVTRNRRDIDAFVVFARPNEIELINPIIESSISFFSGRTIPVFANSYGYNHKYNKNTLRDLRSLVFVDMPFVFPDGRSSELAKEIDELFNRPSSAFLRLFAFGYDALSLSQQAEKLSIFQHLTLTGLSGQLSIDDGGKVHRKLDKLSINLSN